MAALGRALTPSPGGRTGVRPGRAGVGLLLAGLLLAVGPAAPEPARAQASGPRAAPRAAWEVRAPASLGMDREELALAYRKADWMEPLTSLLVARDGELVAEEYWRGLGPDSQVNIKSASKTVLSALVGIALAEGDLRNLHQRVADLLPEYFGEGTDPRKRHITLEHLLTMTSGLETTSFDNYGPWVSGEDWVAGALGQRMVAEPGGRMIYSTGSAHLLAVVLSRATGQDLLAYARRHLFEPLGVPLVSWQRSPRGYRFGGNNMRLSPRGLLRFGQLYLDGGSHAGERIFPEAWVTASWHPRTTSDWNGFDYGYYWWSRELAGHRVHYAWGYGGQFVFVVPDLDLVVVATSEIAAADNGRGHRRAIYRLLERHILPAADARAGATRTGAPPAR